jgi:serine/threonine protein kinase
MIGQMFEGRFQILSVLGKGGAGVVYKAKQTHMDKLVAIKMLMSSVVPNDLSFLRFEQEARAAAALEHPNIITIHDFGRSAAGHAYLVMEYLGGKSLDDVLKLEGRIELEQFLQIFSQICDGLQHAHKRGIVHRDIKPSNIMLVDKDSDHRVAKIVDFGLAKLTAQESEQNLTKSGMVMGTPLFMSPEQCRGAELDYRSDVYSLGCVMYAALTGQVPLKGDSTLNTLYKHMSEPPQPFCVSAPDLNLPPALEQVILKALEKDAESRQQSMSELRNEISDAIYMRNLPSKSADGGTTKVTGKDNHGKGAVQRPVGEELSHTIEISRPAKDKGSLTPAPHAPGGSEQASAGKTATRAYSIPLPKKDRSRTDFAPKLIGISILAAIAISAGVFALLNQKKSESKPQNPSGNSKTDALQNDPHQTTLSTPSRLVAAPSGSNTPSHLVAATAPASSSSSHLVSTNTAPGVVYSVTPAAHPASTIKATLTPKHTALDSSLTRQSPPHKSPQLIRKEILDRAVEDKKQATKELKQAHYGVAMSLLQKCLSNEQSVYGSGDPHLFPTYSRILGCLMASQNESQVKPYLDTALEIFSKRGKQVVPMVEKMENPVSVWKPMARSSRLVARQSSGANMDLFNSWAADFYELALKAWQGSTNDPEYKQLAAERTQLAIERRLKSGPLRQVVEHIQLDPLSRAPQARPRHRHLGRGIREF